MNIFQSIIFGIVEGLTEFLPISSTAHLDLVRYFFSIPASPFLKSFEIIIQLGAIMAVVVIYFRKLLSFKVLRAITISFIPTGIVGFLIYSFIKTYLLGNTFVIASALLIGGIIIILFEKYFKIAKMEDREVESLSVKELLYLGAAQALAVIPGVSRSGAVIIFGRAINIPRKLITEFSFLLAIPTIGAATFYDVYKNGFSFSPDQWLNLSIAFVASFIVAYFVIKVFLDYIRNHSFSIFGWYRIILGIIVFISLFWA